MTTQPLTARLALRVCLRLSVKPPHHSTQGFTLIEALIAIVIVAITLVSITPPIFLATATRVQNRRVQQAQQIAQGEVDRIRLMVERQQTDAMTYLPPLVGGNVRAAGNPPAPSGTFTTANAKMRSPVSCPNPDDDTSQAIRLVDSDGDCQPDFIVQTFRGGEVRDSATIATAPPDGFVMGVRVYSIVSNGSIRSTEPAKLQATNGLGNQRNLPLAVSYGSVARNNSSKSLEIYNQLCTAGASGC
jgi:prepilin-type N-terminal cleavage/methylation domain-containing protein